MREIIIATDRDNLKLLVEKEINQYRNKCNLNHIDISKVKDLSYLFYDSQFNGDISKWDTSSVTDMSGLLYKSQFNGDLSTWDVSSVSNMHGLFTHSKFNGDISNWDVSNVTDMSGLFERSKFTGDVSFWRPLKVKTTEDMFRDCKARIPYWFGNNNEEIIKAIESYDLFNKINGDLKVKSSSNRKKLKI